MLSCTGLINRVDLIYSSEDWQEDEGSGESSCSLSIMGTLEAGGM